MASGMPILPITGITYSGTTATATLGINIPSAYSGTTVSVTITGASPAAFDGTFTATYLVSGGVSYLTYTPTTAPSPTTATGTDICAQSSTVTLDGAISRVTAEIDHAGTYAGVIDESYAYLGLDTIVITDQPQPGMQLGKIQGASHLDCKIIIVNRLWLMVFFRGSLSAMRPE